MKQKGDDGDDIYVSAQNETCLQHDNRSTISLVRIRQDHAWTSSRKRLMKDRESGDRLRAGDTDWDENNRLGMDNSLPQRIQLSNIGMDMKMDKNMSQFIQSNPLEMGSE